MAKQKSTLTIWDRLRGRREEEREAVARGFEEVVEAIAAGAEPDEGEIWSTLESCDASIEDLQSAVVRSKERRRLRAIIATEPDTLEASRRLEETIAGTEFEKAKAAQQFDEQLAKLAAEQDELRRQRLEASEAERVERVVLRRRARHATENPPD
ncbi:MAG: hypothetical protein U0935_05800 [Pirellulales bacterium]